MSSSSLGGSKKGRTGDSSMLTRTVRQLAIASGIKSSVGSSKSLRTLYGSAPITDATAGTAAKLVLTNLVNNNSGVIASTVSGSDGFWVCGQYTSVSLIVYNSNGNSSGITLVGDGISDAFIIKYNSAGFAVWAARIAGASSDSANYVTVDSQGNLYVVGYYQLNSLTVYNSNGNSSGITLANNGLRESFIVKYNSDGFAVWAARMGEASNVTASSVIVDSQGNLYIAGYYDSGSLTVYNSNGTSSGITLAGDGSRESFIVKYNSPGFAVWATRMAGTGSDSAVSIAIDSQGNLYVTGYYMSVLLTVYNSNGNSSGITLAGDGIGDAFIIKYNSAGSAVWAARIAGASNDSANYITVDSQGNLYIAGFYSSGLLTLYDYNGGSSGITLANNGSNDAFIVKYHPEGAALWATRMTGASNDSAVSIAIDSQGNLYVAGFYASLLTVYNSNDNSSGITLANNGSNDAFIVKYNSDGLAVWATRIAGTGGDVGYSITIDSQGNLCVAGFYTSVLLTVYNSNGTSSGITLAGDGSRDSFIVKYNSAGFALWAARIGGASNDSLYSVAAYRGF